MSSVLRHWLAPADPIVDADMIFVLAGRPNRKRYALQLFREGRAPQLVLSTARFEVRRFKELPLPSPLDLLPVAAPVPPPERHFFVTFRAGETQAEIEKIRVHRFGTLREIEALAAYLAQRPEIRSVLAITSAAHVRRVRMCCRALLPEGIQFRIAAVPEDTESVPGAPHGEETESSLEIATELVKLLGYSVLLAIHRGPRVKQS